jgi:hypothetical protein
VNEPEYDVFVSYSHADRDWVQGQLLPTLEGAGLKVLIDYRDFEVGTHSLVNMERAVEQSRHTVVVLTPAWVASQWTEFESLLVGNADPAGRKHKLVPLMLEPCELPSRIAAVAYADLTDPDTRDKQLEGLLRALDGSASAPTTDYHKPTRHS